MRVYTKAYQEVLQVLRSQGAATKAAQGVEGIRKRKLHREVSKDTRGAEAAAAAAVRDDVVRVLKRVHREAGEVSAASVAAPPAQGDGGNGASAR